MAPDDKLDRVVEHSFRDRLLWTMLDPDIVSSDFFPRMQEEADKKKSTYLF